MPRTDPERQDSSTRRLPAPHTPAFPPRRRSRRDVRLSLSLKRNRKRRRSGNRRDASRRILLMGRINTNIPSLQAIHRLTRNNTELATRLQRLSTGLRINTGKDAPAALIASETLRSEINGIHQAIDNSQRANNVVNTAEGALGEVSALLLEIQGLTNEAANTGALSDQEIEANQ